MSPDPDLREFFTAEKFFPPRCPNCLHDFSQTPDDFALWAGSRGQSFTDALVQQAQNFPEIYGPVTRAEGVFTSSGRLGMSFIICRHCSNKTLRIDYARRQVATRDEAIALQRDHGFTSVASTYAFGSHAQPMAFLSLLGQADIELLQSHTRTARAKASVESGGAGTEQFFAAMDPVLVEIAGRVRRGRREFDGSTLLAKQFGSLWPQLPADTRVFLETAELVLESIDQASAGTPDIDYSPAVAAYSKALEFNLHDRIFHGLRGRNHTPEKARASDGSPVARSLGALAAFVEGTRALTLGDMGHCLKNLGGAGPELRARAFGTWLDQVFIDPVRLLETERYGSAVIRYVETYRNRAAHLARLSREDCMAARAYLVSEPVELLVCIERALRCNATL